MKTLGKPVKNFIFKKTTYNWWMDVISDNIEQVKA